MAEDIPPEFDRSWRKSDVVLHTLNSDGKELHANKVALALFSSYFDTLFSGRFEKDVHTVEMDCDYSAMKEVLRNIHQVDCDYSSEGNKKYDSKMLKELYHIGDYYNFGHIRKLCLDQMHDMNRNDSIKAAAELNLRDIVMEILQQQTASKVKQFLALDIDYFFSKNEFRKLFKKVTGCWLLKPTTASPPARRLNLEEITVELQNPRIDLTKPWELADLAISTESSLGRLLYSNKTIIDSVSIAFKRLEFTPNKGTSMVSVTVDADYTTMKEILSVIHHCDTNYQAPSRKLHPALLHSVYRAASEGQLDIPMIRDLCVAKLLKQKSIDSWEVLRDLNFKVEVPFCPIDQCLEWIFREDEHLSYRKGDRIVVVTPCHLEPLFRSSSVLTMIEKLYKKQKK